MSQLERYKEGGISFLRGGRGEPLLLLHGIPGSSYSWEGAGEILAEHFDVIAPDLLGFGHSDPPQGDYYMESQARALRELLGSLGIGRFYLGAHDFGGPVGLTMMRLHPDLDVRGLVLSATNVFTDTFVPLPLRAAGVPILGTLVFHLMAGNRPAMRMMYLQAAKQKGQVTWERFSRHLTASGIDLTRRIFERSLADLKTNYQDIQDFLPRISAPTLVLWGTGDPFFAVDVGERTQRAVPGASLRIYEDTGHFVPEERPDLVARDIRQFLGR